MPRLSLPSAWSICLLTALSMLSAVPTFAAEFTSPAAGVAWSIGSLHVVTWKAADWPADAKLNLEFSTDDGQTWSSAAANVPNTGKTTWKVPGPISAQAQLRLSLGDKRVVSPRLSIIASQEVPEYAWTNVTMKGPFAPRDGAGAVTYKGKMWLLGGWNPGDKKFFPRICNNEVWSSANGLDWTLEKPNTFLDASFDPTKDWEGRHTAGYVVYKDKMWIVGGDVNQRHYQDDVWNSSDGKSWTFVNAGKPVPWGPRALHYTVVHNDAIWVIGGQTMAAFAKSEEKFYRDIWRTTDGVNWETVTPKEPYWSPRGMIGHSAVMNGRIWILGGGTYDTPTIPARQFMNDVWSSADGVTWTQNSAEAPWNPRQYHDVSVYDNRLWVMEGYHVSSGNRNDVWYSSDGVNWYEVPATPWKPRHAASPFVHNGALWMVIGNNMESDVWKLQRKSK